MPTRISHYDVGDVWVPQATFTISGTPTDPTNLTVRQQDAAGTETILLNNVAVSGLTGSSTPVAKVSTGVFKLNPGITLTASGYWFMKFEGTGTAAATETQQVIVDPDEFAANAGLDARALVGLPETKDWLQQQNIDTSNDLELVRTINDISNRFHEEAEREFKVRGTNPQTRTFDVGYNETYCQAVEIDDLASAPTQVQIISYDWTTVLATLTSADYTLYPKVRDTWEPIRKIQFKYTVLPLRVGYRVSVTGTWGFPSVPGTVRQAVLDAVAAVMDRDVEHYSQDQSPQTGGQGTNVVVFAGQRTQFISLPPEALAVARRFNDPGVG